MERDFEIGKVAVKIGDKVKAGKTVKLHSK